MELKWSQNDIKIDQKTMSKKHRKNDGQKSQHRANLAPKSLPKGTSLFPVDVQDGGPRALQDPSKSLRTSNMSPRPSQNLPRPPQDPRLIKNQPKID